MSAGLDRSEVKDCTVAKTDWENANQNEHSNRWSLWNVLSSFVSHGQQNRSSNFCQESLDRSSDQKSASSQLVDLQSTDLWGTSQIQFDCNYNDRGSSITKWWVAVRYSNYVWYIKGTSFLLTCDQQIGQTGISEKAASCYLLVYNLDPCEISDSCMFVLLLVGHSFIDAHSFCFVMPNAHQENCTDSCHHLDCIHNQCWDQTGGVALAKDSNSGKHLGGKERDLQTNEAWRKLQLVRACWIKCQFEANNGTGGHNFSYEQHVSRKMSK